jgi:hypothetical protein
MSRSLSDSFFNQLPEDSREELKSFMTAPTYFELTNNGDLSLYESVNTKEKRLPQKRNTNGSKFRYDIETL